MSNQFLQVDPEEVKEVKEVGDDFKIYKIRQIIF